MDRNRTKNIIIIILLIVLIANINNTKNLIKDLKKEFLSSERSLQYSLSNIQQENQNLYKNIEELLEKEQSLFSETKVDLKLQGDKIAISMYAIPKEIRNGEKLIAKITANGETYEEETDDNYKAEFIVDMTEKIKPGFIIKSDSGIRQESLDELLTQDIFTTHVYSEWTNKNKDVLSLWVRSRKGEPPFAEEDIEKAEFIVVDGRKSGDFYMEVAPIIDNIEDFFNHVKGDVIPAVLSPSKVSQGIGYIVDLSEYYKREDNIQYEVYFTLTTKNGMKYITSYNPVATFMRSKGNGSASSGEEILRPIFK